MVARYRTPGCARAVARRKHQCTWPITLCCVELATGQAELTALPWGATRKDKYPSYEARPVDDVTASHTIDDTATLLCNDGRHGTQRDIEPRSRGARRSAGLG